MSDDIMYGGFNSLNFHVFLEIFYLRFFLGEIKLYFDLVNKFRIERNDVM